MKVCLWVIRLWVIYELFEVKLANDTYREICSKWEIKKVIESSNYDDTLGEYELPNKLGLLDRFP